MAAYSSRWSCRSLCSLFCLLLVSFVVRTHAQRLHSSCQNLRGKNSEGVITNYGDVRGQISIAVQEAGDIASTARAILENAANGQASAFDTTRATQSFNTFQGTEDGTGETARDRRDKVLRSLASITDYVNNRNTRDPVILCGDDHLTKFTNYEDGSPILDSNGNESFQYYDSYTQQWLPIGEGGCEDAAVDLAITMMGRYIQVCPAAFSFALRVEPRATIDNDVNVDWSSEEYAGDYRQSLDYWATPLSFTMFHELTHFLLNYEDYYLQTIVQWIGGETNKAYRFNGATQLVAENINQVSNNVDNLAMLALSLYMRTNNWSTGKAGATAG